MTKAEKCIICEEEIKINFLGKPEGTVVKIKQGDKNELMSACSSCQKKYKDSLRKEIEKLYK